MYPLLIALLFNLVSSQSYYYPLGSYGAANYLLFNRNPHTNRVLTFIPSSYVHPYDSIFSPIQNDKTYLYYYLPPSRRSLSSSAPSFYSSTNYRKSDTLCKNDNVKLDYGKCPQLELTEEEKLMKEERIKECLKNLDLNESIKIESVNNSLKNKVIQCLLKKSELLDDQGKYQYDKALEKLKAKGLDEDIQKQLEQSHEDCKNGSKALRIYTSLFPALVYTNCMNFHIKMICDIKEVKEQTTAEPTAAINIPYDEMLADLI